ncbi:MAG: FeoB-associated Cys-rich membrane protein [Ruminiclostridium sp.]|nr:FeoB-associated Cys-rich membrane protein [Ruminiclostridium sp.]
MNIVDIILIVLIVAAVAAAIIFRIRAVKRGKTCCGSCTECRRDCGKRS